MRENTPPHDYFESLEYDDDDEEIINWEEVPMSESEDEAVDSDDDDIPKVPERDDSILTFREHKAAVFCCSMHPTKEIAATGGEDDCAYVWDINTGKVIHRIESHNDTVITASFSHDGKYLVTGDMAGRIKVFKVETMKLVQEYLIGDTHWIKWHPASNVLMAGTDIGDIYIWRIPSGDCKILPGKTFKCESAQLSNDGKKLFCGYGNGSVKLWDIKNNCGVVEVKPNHGISHSRSVNSVSCSVEKSLYISGSADGLILVTTNSGPITTLDPQAGNVEVVTFCPDPELKVAASGTLNGQIDIWDMVNFTLRATCERPEYHKLYDGIITLRWLPQQTLLCGTVFGSIFANDGRNGRLKFDLHGHVAEVFDCCYNQEKGILLTASEDRTAKIFQVPL